METSMRWWLPAIGMLVQAPLFMRCCWLWAVRGNGKPGTDAIPVSFWYSGLLGSFFPLMYAVLRRDVVFVVGQSVGTIVYFCALCRIHRERKRSQSTG